MSSDSSVLPGAEEKMRLTAVAHLDVPVGGQEIDLQQVDYIHGGTPQLRIRIREGKRFTIFDIDPVTAGQWGDAMRRWADAHGGAC
jgi:hypothetical protein